VAQLVMATGGHQIADEAVPGLNHTFLSLLIEAMKYVYVLKDKS
jgi:hypothetical protein